MNFLTPLLFCNLSVSNLALEIFCCIYKFRAFTFIFTHLKMGNKHMLINPCLYSSSPFLKAKSYSSALHLIALLSVLKHVCRGAEVPLALLEILCHLLNKKLLCQERINTFMSSCWLKTALLFYKGPLGIHCKAFPMV